MLERAPATAESAAHLFLRTFDRPCRTTRVLDPKFWRNGPDHIDPPSWWPLYLQQVRQVPQTRSSGQDPVFVIQPGPKLRNSSSVPSETCLRRSKSPMRAPRTRSYTASVSTHQSLARQGVYDTFGLAEITEKDEADGENDEGDYEKEDHTTWQRRRHAARPNHEKRLTGRLGNNRQNFETLNTEVVDHKPLPSVATLAPAATGFDFTSPLASMIPDTHIEASGTRTVSDLSMTTSPENSASNNTPDRYLNAKDRDLSEFDILLHMGDEADQNQLERAWELFTSSDNQERRAPAMFRLLTRSQEPAQLHRALQAFRMIPQNRRSAAQYDAAISLESRHLQYKNAIDLAIEASHRSFTPVPGLLAHFVENLLWEFAVELIQRHSLVMGEGSLAPTPFPQLLHRETLLKSVLNINNLHLKVAALAEHIKSSIGTVLENRKLLRALMDDLATAYVQNKDLMSAVTPAELLKLLTIHERVGLVGLHVKALHTLSNIPKRGHKADLALMIYRNLRFAWPSVKVQRSTLFALLRICTDANCTADILDYVLTEFEVSFDKPDQLAYQLALTCSSRQGDVNTVKHLFSRYTTHHGPPKLLMILNPLIHVHTAIGNVAGARAQFDRISAEFGLQPNIVSWNMLLAAHARSNDDISVFKVFDEMRGAMIKPDSISFSTILGVCASHADIEKTLEILANARNEGVQISGPMVGYVIKCYLSNHDIKAARHFAIAVSESDTDIYLTPIWNRFIRYFAAKGDIQSLLGTRKLMSRYNVAADEMTYAAIMSALVTTKKTSEAVDVLRQMHRGKGLAATTLHYSIILHGFVREGNRNMAIIIANEMRHKFPQMSSSANEALLRLQSQRDASTASYGAHSLKLLVNLLNDLYSSDTASLPLNEPYGKPPRKSAIASLYVETITECMIRNGSPDEAAQLLRQLEGHLSKGPFDGARHSGRASKLLLAKMNVAIARGDIEVVNAIWGHLFKQAKVEYMSIDHLRNSQNAESDEKAGSPKMKPRPTVLKAWCISLSKPLTRYMEAMAQAGRQEEVTEFLRKDFRTAGFRLTSFDSNKYVQILCRSTLPQHHVRAFKFTERLLLNRAQSWKLLARGLLKQEQSTHKFEVIGNQKRPVLQRHTSTKVVNRLDVMRLHPRRHIPTYTTMVHLASVLQYAQTRIRTSDGQIIRLINKLAGRTKRFVQNIPYLKDHVQGTLLRAREMRSNPAPRPRSEQSIRQKSDVAGILSSPLDSLPAESSEDIDLVVMPNGDLRHPLGGNASIHQSSRNEDTDIALAEKLFGKINRNSIILPSKGRFETELETARRVEREEKFGVQSVQKMREEQTRKQPTGEVSASRPDVELQTPYLEESAVRYAPTESRAPSKGGLLPSFVQKAIETSERIIANKTQSVQVSPPVTGVAQFANAHDWRIKQATLSKLPVAQQVDVLRSHRAEAMKKGRHFVRSTFPGLALDYAERRRVRNLRALRQRKQARYLLDTMQDSLSDRAMTPRTKAGRIFAIREQARSRRRTWLQYQARLARGERPVQPLPKTQRGHYERLLEAGPASVRPVADLNRNKKQIMYRRGIYIDRRRPRVYPPIKLRRNMLVRMRRPSKSEDVVRPQLDSASAFKAQYRRPKRKLKAKTRARIKGLPSPKLGRRPSEALAVGSTVGGRYRPMGPPPGQVIWEPPFVPGRRVRRSDREGYKRVLRSDEDSE